MASDNEDYLEGAETLEQADEKDDSEDSLASFKDLVIGTLEKHELDKHRASKMEIVDFL